LRQVANPDEVITHRPGRCRGCDGDLADAAGAGVGVRQVFDVPPLTRLRVVEHRLQACRCRTCGVVTTAPAPAGVTAPAQYGPGIAAVVVYLIVRQHLPVARAAELCAELLAAPVSTGWITTQVRAASAALTGFEAAVKDTIRAAPVAHFDETGARINGGLDWIHTATTETATWYQRHDKRGRDDIDDIDILPGFTGIAVHDAWTRTCPTATSTTPYATPTSYANSSAGVTSTPPATNGPTRPSPCSARHTRPPSPPSPTDTPPCPPTPSTPTGNAGRTSSPPATPHDRRAPAAAPSGPYSTGCTAAPPKSGDSPTTCQLAHHHRRRPLAPHPRLHLHRHQERHQRDASPPRRPHRQRLATHTHHLNSYWPRSRRSCSCGCPFASLIPGLRQP
jgi:transposase